MKQITIDFDKLKEIALRGIRRTTVFLGLGVNAARDERFREYQLTDVTIFRLVPDKVEDTVVTEFKDSFEKWVISNGLRELIETFAVFLDKVHQVCLLMATHKKSIGEEDADTFGPAFEWKGVEDKLKILRERFGIQSDKEKYFSSINQARNCITHRRGKVGPEDLRGTPSFKLVWWAFDVYAETPSGKKINLMPPFPKGGIYLDEGATVKMKINEREKEYQLGNVISLSPTDVNEICFLVKLATDDISKGAIQFAQNIGIQVVEKQSKTQ